MKEPGALYCTAPCGYFHYVPVLIPWEIKLLRNDSTEAGSWRQCCALPRKLCGFMSKQAWIIWAMGRDRACLPLSDSQTKNKQMGQEDEKVFQFFFGPGLYLNKSSELWNNSEGSWSSEFSWLTEDVRVYITEWEL